MTFVTDGVASAIEQAKGIAGEKAVAVASPTLVQQCLVPILLGDGVRLFESLKTAPIALESPQVREGSGVMHLTYRVKK